MLRMVIYLLIPKRLVIEFKVRMTKFNKFHRYDLNPSHFYIPGNNFDESMVQVGCQTRRELPNKPHLYISTKKTMKVIKSET